MAKGKPKKNKQKSRPANQRKVQRASSIPKTEVSVENTMDVASMIERRMKLTEERKALDAIRAQLDQDEQELEQQQNAVAEKEESLARQKEALKSQENALRTDQEDLAKANKDLAKKLEDVVRREQKADAEFGELHEQSVRDWESRVSQIRIELDQAQGRLTEARVSAYAKLSDDIEEERSTRLKGVDEEVGRRRERLLDELAQERVKHDKKLEEERTALAIERGRLEDEGATLEAMRINLQEQQVELSIELQLLEAERRGLNTTIANRVQEHISADSARVSAMEGQLEALQGERETLHSRILKLESSQRRFGTRTAEEVEEELKTLRAERETLQNKLDRRPPENALDRLDELQAERDALDRTRTTLQQELAQLKGERHTWLMEQAELEHQRDRAESARRMKDAFEAEAERLDDQVQRLRSLYEQPKEMEARIGAIEQPRFDSLPSSEQDEGIGELEWLDRIHDRCMESGLSFPQRLLYAFHTSLKVAEWAPMTVLGGVSGTGKSELPRLYARFGGLAFEPLSVQPNWDSPQSLFGFFNSVDNRFNATPLLRALVQSQKQPYDMNYEGGLSNRLLLVLLDELNLSHVELYFSELLSKLELRRGSQEDVMLEIDLGAGLEEYKLPLKRNVLWVGTMNEDETTKSLSDKVLDRANMLGFPRPRELRRRQEATLMAPEPMLPFSKWEEWICQKSDLGPDEIGKYKAVLEQMNTHLERVGRALGHRVWQSIESYMANYPTVRSARISGDQDAMGNALKVAFEDALVQKVMPKLRGIETSGKARDECLDPIARLLGDRELGLRLAEDFGLATSVGYSFVWRSARYLEASE